MGFRSDLLADNEICELRPWEQHEIHNDEEVIVAARSSLECTVYYDPDQIVEADFEQIKARVRTDIWPRYRIIALEPLTRADIMACTPFTTTAEEAKFFVDGYRRAPNQTTVGIPQEGRLGTTKERTHALKCNYDGFYGLTAKTKALLTAIQNIVPAGALPKWLQNDVGEILYPVCGSRESRRDKDSAIRVTRDGEFWLGCDDFSARRTIYPAVAAIPDSALTKGCQPILSWYDLPPVELEGQIRREITDCFMARQESFDLPALALFMCQNIIRLRLAAESVRRHLAARHALDRNEDRVNAGKDLKIRQKIQGLHDIDPEHNEVTIERWCPTFADRVLIAFYGGTCAIPHHTYRSERLRIERLAHWAGMLRRTQLVELDAAIAEDVLAVFSRPSRALQDLFDDPDMWSVFAIFESLLGKSGWDVVERAAMHVIDCAEAFDISYKLSDQGHRGTGAYVDLSRKRVSLVGPALLLPVEGLKELHAYARSISPRGLYAI